MNTNEFGHLVETRIKGKLLEIGKKVLVPEIGPYDLALDEDGNLVRIECKHGVLRKGAIIVNARCNGRTKERGHYSNTYHGRADLIAVWNQETDRFFLIPVEEIGKSGVFHIRLEEAKNSQQRGVNSAAKYEI